MNLCFGEILIDQNSRAFYDDYDDLSLNKNLDRPQWKWANEGVSRVPENVNRFIIVEGINARNIVQTYVDKKQLLCTSRSSSVFELQDHDYLCVAEEQDLNYYSSMTELLDGFQKNAKECIVVSLQNVSDYKSSNRPDSCIIEGINSKFSDIPNLQPPNFLTGISAGVASSRMTNDKSFSCYAVFVDFYDEHAIKIIVNHLKRINLPCVESLKVKPLHHKSDLYM